MSWRRGWISVFLFTLAMINYVDRVALSVASHSISEEFGLSKIAMGYLFSSFLWTYLLCLLPMGILVDRFGSRALNAVGIAVWSAATMLTGAAWSFGTLIATRLAMGVGEATTFPTGGRVVREWIPARERGLTNAIFMAGTQAGPAVGALIVAWIVSRMGWRGSFLVVGAVGFVWLVAWLVWYDVPERVRWLGREERDKILRERDADTEALTRRSGSSRVLDLLGTRTMWGLALANGCAVYTQYLFLTWLPSYLQETRHLDVVKTGLFTAVPYAGAAVLGIVLGRVSDRILTHDAVGQGRRRSMDVVMMLSSAVILFTPFVDSTIVILALFTLSLTGIATAISLNFSLVNDLLRSAEDSGKAMSILIVGGNVFGILAPIVTGYVIEWTGSYNWAFGIAGLLLVTGATIMLTMTRSPIEIESSRMGAAGPA
ncbi:MAG: MFS transporter [Betaproteobacteria bacterium]|nr:MFS transporter [Betaproteobacteria bacterium]